MSKYVAGDLIKDLKNSIIRFYGDPVQQNEVFLFAVVLALITGGEKIAEDICWDGAYEEVIAS